MRSIVELRKKSTVAENVNLPGKMLKSGLLQTAQGTIPTLALICFKPVSRYIACI
jgi:hypothetical protein